MFIYLSAEEPVMGTACSAKPAWILDGLTEFHVRRTKTKTTWLQLDSGPGSQGLDDFSHLTARFPARQMRSQAKIFQCRRERRVSPCGDELRTEPQKKKKKGWKRCGISSTAERPQRKSLTPQFQQMAVLAETAATQTDSWKVPFEQQSQLQISLQRMWHQWKDVSIYNSHVPVLSSV